MIIKKIQWLALMLLINVPVFSMEYDPTAEEYLEEEFLNLLVDDYTTTEEYLEDQTPIDPTLVMQITPDLIDKIRNIIRKAEVPANGVGPLIMCLENYKSQRVIQREWNQIVGNVCNQLPRTSFSDKESYEIKVIELRCELACIFPPKN